MKIKYFCEECCDDDLFEEDEIAYKYQLNVSGKYPVWYYVCKKCNALSKDKGDKK